MTRTPTRERGAALLVALLSMTLIMALGLALGLISSIETAIAGNARADLEALYAADAGLERALADMRSAPDWTAVVSGLAASSFRDGSMSERRIPADGRSLTLIEATNLLNCRKTTTCTGAEMDAHTGERPWGANNPRWQAYLWGPLEDLLKGSGLIGGGSSMFIVAWVADDQLETDGQPLLEGGGTANPGRGILVVRAAAFSPSGASRAVEATIQRDRANDRDPSDGNGSELPPGEAPAAGGELGLRVLSWRMVQ